MATVEAAAKTEPAAGPLGVIPQDHDLAGPRKATKPAPLAKPAPKVAEPVERLYVVLADRKVPRVGGSLFTLRKGKVISDRGYDVPELMHQGVLLEEVKGAGA